MGKILNFNARTEVKNFSTKAIKNELLAADVLDMTQARQEILNRDRREVKRTILTEFVGAFIVLPEKGLMKVSLYDISENGISFELPLEEGSFMNGEEVAMRVYLNHTTYFPFSVSIANVRLLPELGMSRQGANFIKGTINDVALHHFVKFIENVSASLKTDSGDVQVSNIS